MTSKGQFIYLKLSITEINKYTVHRVLNHSITISSNVTSYPEIISLCLLIHDLTTTSHNNDQHDAKNKC